MYMRAVTFRIVYLGLVSVGILLSATLRDSTVQAAPLTQVSTPSANAPAAKPSIVTLATVNVRAAAGHTATHAAPLTRATAAGNARLEVGEDHAGAALPSLRLDMPYYSFGKLLPRVGKE